MDYLENNTAQSDTEVHPWTNQSTIENILWSTICGLICVPTVFGNSLILICVIKYNGALSSIHTLIGNLAVSDLIVGAVLLPFCIVTSAAELDASKYVCLTKASILILSIGGTCYGLLLISVDRFIAICYPMQYAEAFTKRRLIVILASGWSYVIIFAVFPLSGWNFYDRNLPYSCGTDQVFTPIYQRFIIGNFIFILFLNFILYIFVMKTAIRKSGQIYAEERLYNFRRNSRDIYRVKTMGIVQGVFLICWLPYIILSVLVSFSHDMISRKAQYWSLILGLLNSTFNWVIYGYRNKQLRGRMKAYLICCYRTSQRKSIR